MPSSRTHRSTNDRTTKGVVPPTGQPTVEPSQASARASKGAAKAKTTAQAKAKPQAKATRKSTAKGKTAKPGLTAAKNLPAKRSLPTQQTTPRAPASDLSKALQARIDELGLSHAAAARSIGVNSQGLLRVLRDGAEPNARTKNRYARWLKQPNIAKAKAQRHVRSARKSDAVGRKGTDIQDLMRLPLAQVLTLAGRKQEAPTPAHAGLLGDRLAQKVHQASKRIRDLIGTLLTIRS